MLNSQNQNINNMKMRPFLVLGLLSLTSLAWSQAPENWFNLDPAADGVQGVSTEKMYKELLGNEPGQVVIVAVIDSGVDPEHEDLKDVMWVNEDEIPGNGIDDDNNGYIDDIHGWNFIGGKNGENVNHDTYEATRLYAKYKAMYDGKDREDLKKKERKQYDEYVVLKEIIEEKREELSGNLSFYEGLLGSIGELKKTMGKEDITAEDLEGFETEDPAMIQAKAVLTNALKQVGSLSEIEGELEGAVEYFGNSLNYGYNPDFKPRSIVGDNYANSYEKGYGNNDVKGPDASHGTHVAGIIGASRDNGVGIKGVSNNVRIMSVRAVPDGDERDKDVANAIIYAVDNGASIINMSFGKGYSWDKEAVDKAVKYAVKNDVLLVHAAGNSAQDNDTSDNFPNDTFGKKGLFGPKQAATWMEIGALSYKGGEDAPASFSNYGKTEVDVFAPGVQILSTTPDGGYESFSGTSMASPVTAGVAAVLRSYYPELTAEQVKEIIMASVDPLSQKVNKPGEEEQVPFSELSVTGGVVNVYKAVEMAKKTKGKKKMKKNSGSSGNGGSGSGKKKGGQA